MKKVIKGKTYNTKTSKLLVVASNYYCPNITNETPDYLARADPYWCREQLWQGPKGNWFIVGTGGPQTIYGGCKDNIGLRAISPSEAVEWLTKWKVSFRAENFSESGPGSIIITEKTNDRQEG